MNTLSRHSLGVIASAVLAAVATSSFAQPQSNSDMGGNASATRIQGGAGTVPFQSLGGPGADTAVRNSATMGAGNVPPMGVTTGPASYSGSMGTTGANTYGGSTGTTTGASGYGTGSTSGGMANDTSGTTAATTNNNYSGASANAPAGTVAGSSGMSSPSGSTNASGTSGNTYGTTSSATGSGGMSSNLSNTASSTDTTGGTSANTASSTDNTGSSTAYNNANMQPLPTEPTAAGSSSYSWLPYTNSGYVGLSIGSGKLNTDCVAGETCDDPKGSVHVYTGGLFNQNFGIELGYFRLGDADRNGGKTKVSGVSLVLTGIAPLGYNFNLNGRVGGTYGWTTTNIDATAALAGAPSGDKNSFGATYGVGLSYDFTRNWSVTLDWDRHHLKYAGDVRRNTDIGTIGLKYRF